MPEHGLQGNSTQLSCSAMQRSVHRTRYGVDSQGHYVDMLTLRNLNGVEVEVLTYGGIVRAIRVPDRNGFMGDVVLGFDTIAEYEHNRVYVGALIGRYANRIAHGRFTLDGHEFVLSRNDGDNHLHGGTHGFNAVHWSVAEVTTPDSVGVVLHHLSPAHEDGYPGSLNVRVMYTLTDANAFVVEYRAESSAATPVSLTQHSYFNLSGDAGSNILGHELLVNSTLFTPVDAAKIPTGALRAVANTPFDFSAAHPIGERIYDHDDQLQHGGGYDHSFVIRHDGARTSLAARLRDPLSGRTLEITTTEPAIQLYSGSVFDGTQVGKHGQLLSKYAGVALETQQYPDSPNHPHFPSTIIRPGIPYESRTMYQFLVVP